MSLCKTNCFNDHDTRYLMCVFALGKIKINPVGNDYAYVFSLLSAHAKKSLTYNNKMVKNKNPMILSSL